MLVKVQRRYTGGSGIVEADIPEPLASIREIYSTIHFTEKWQLLLGATIEAIAAEIAANEKAMQLIFQDHGGTPLVLEFEKYFSTPLFEVLSTNAGYTITRDDSYLYGITVNHHNSVVYVAGKIRTWN